MELEQVCSQNETCRVHYPLTMVRQLLLHNNENVKIQTRKDKKKIKENISVIGLQDQKVRKNDDWN